MDFVLILAVYYLLLDYVAERRIGLCGGELLGPLPFSFNFHRKKYNQKKHLKNYIQRYFAIQKAPFFFYLPFYHLQRPKTPLFATSLVLHLHPSLKLLLELRFPLRNR